jgi:hypothetical protein
MRPTLEEVGGHWCHVVDLPTDSGVGNMVSVWIDTDRGFLPVRQVQFAGAMGQHVLATLEIQEAVQLESGLWVPVRGRKSIGVVPGIAQLAAASEVVFSVDRNAEGRYLVEVNAAVDDSLFDLREHLPPGFRVFDLRTRETWIAATGEYEKVGSTLKTVIANAPLRINRHGIPVQGVDRDLTAPSARLGTQAAAFGGGAVLTMAVGFVAFARRRIRQ